MSGRSAANDVRVARRYGLRSGGFTLVELVVILVVLSVLAVLAVPRLGDTSAYQARGFQDELAAVLRYGQKVAVATGCQVDVQIAGGYSLSFASDPDCPSGELTSPGRGGALSASPPSGVSVSGSGFSFGSLGAVVGGANQTLTVNPGGRQITVAGETGYVEVQ